MDWLNELIGASHLLNDAISRLAVWVVLELGTAIQYPGQLLV